MTPSARLAAAIEVLAEILTRHRPASQALADWGKAHRFAGSGDRSVIGTLVYDVLRRKSSLAWQIGDDTPRALVLSYASIATGSRDSAERLFSGENFAPARLTQDERARIAAPQLLADAPLHVQGDYPAWLDASLARVYGEERADELAAHTRRAPVDIRVNTLKTDRARMLTALERYGARPGNHAPSAIRIAPPEGSQRAPHIESEAAYQKGQIEIQDEGSQIAALLAQARPGMQVADLCAGGGGKTLALAAAMENSGQLYAYDADRHRLAPIHQRLSRAGVRNCQVLEAGDFEALRQLEGRLDLVVLDVPCTGSGTWRRRPDSKWRLKAHAIAQRQREQDELLLLAARLVRLGGEIAYITCSLLAEENEERIETFLNTEPATAFKASDMRARWGSVLGAGAPTQPEMMAGMPGLRLSPRSAGTDAFYVSILTKNGD